MNLVLLELRKALATPIVVVMIGACLAFNLLLMFAGGHPRSELQVVNQMAESLGFKIDAQFLTANQVAANASGDEERAVRTYYANRMKGIDNLYHHLDLNQVATAQINMHQLTGAAAQTVRGEYAALGVRFKQIVADGEYRTLFFDGKLYRMHSLLFRTLFGAMIFEIIILVVMMTGFLVNYEFEHDTSHVAYTSRRGRRMIRDKLVAALLATTIVSIVIMGTTLPVYFHAYNYTGLWHVPISSAFNAEYSLPYISWWDLSIAQFLAACVVLTYGCALLFAGVAFLVSTWIRNSYLVFVASAIVLGVGVALPGLMPNSSNLVFLSEFTPFTLILNPHLWFMESGAFTTFKFYEIWTFAVWFVLLSLLSVLRIKRFRTQNL